MSTIFKLPLFVVCYSQQSLTFKREAVMKDRLREPSTKLGIGMVLTGIASILAKDYATGAAQIITGILGIFTPEAMSK